MFISISVKDRILLSNNRQHEEFAMGTCYLYTFAVSIFGRRFGVTVSKFGRRFASFLFTILFQGYCSTAGGRFYHVTCCDSARRNNIIIYIILQIHTHVCIVLLKRITFVMLRK